MVGRMMRARYLAAGLVLIVLLVAVAGLAFAYGRVGSTADENGMGSMMGNGQMGPMMGGGMMGGDRMMDSSDEERPFDLQFIDQMILHHQGAIMSSEHMISDSERR